MNTAMTGRMSRSKSKSLNQRLLVEALHAENIDENLDGSLSMETKQLVVANVNNNSK